MNKNQIFILLFALCSTVLSAQIPGGISQLNVVSTKLKDIDLTKKDYQVSVYYYNIKGNIDNKSSSAFISSKPTASQLVQFATTFPSYVFVIKVNDEVMNYLVLHQMKEGKGNKYVYAVLDGQTGKQVRLIESNMQGEMTEWRAKELHEQQYDKHSKILDINGDKSILFDRSAYEIQRIRWVKAEVEKLIPRYKLFK